MLGVSSGGEVASYAIPLLRGQSITLSASGTWNVFDADGFPDCGPGGLSSEDLQGHVIEPLKRKISEGKDDDGSRARWLRAIESGLACDVPSAPPGALLGQFRLDWAEQNGLCHDAIVVGAEDQRFTAPCDGWLVLKPNKVALGDGAGPARAAHGAGMRVRIGGVK